MTRGYSGSVFYAGGLKFLPQIIGLFQQAPPSDNPPVWDESKVRGI